MRDPIRYDKAPTNGGRMSERTRARTGGQLLVDALKVHGVDLAFCVPGESYLAVLDALYDARNSIRLVTCRQEAGPPTWPRPTAS